jgi:hypothetical protein
LALLCPESPLRWRRGTWLLVLLLGALGWSALRAARLGAQHDGFAAVVAGEHAAASGYRGLYNRAAAAAVARCAGPVVGVAFVGGAVFFFFLFFFSFSLSRFHYSDRDPVHRIRFPGVSSPQPFGHAGDASPTLQSPDDAAVLVLAQDGHDSALASALENVCLAIRNERRWCACVHALTPRTLPAPQQGPPQIAAGSPVLSLESGQAPSTPSTPSTLPRSASQSHGPTADVDFRALGDLLFGPVGAARAVLLPALDAPQGKDQQSPDQGQNQQRPGGGGGGGGSAVVPGVAWAARAIAMLDTAAPTAFLGAPGAVSAVAVAEAPPLDDLPSAAALAALCAARGGAEVYDPRTSYLLLAADTASALRTGFAMSRAQWARATVALRKPRGGHALWAFFARSDDSMPAALEAATEAGDLGGVLAPPPGAWWGGDSSAEARAANTSAITVYTREPDGTYSCACTGSEACLGKKL